jgi:DNA-directed RNA polymerase specialized sigma24 family protein
VDRESELQDASGDCLAAATSPTPDQVCEDRESFSRAIATLSADEYKLIHLRSLGFKYSDIAALTGCSVSTLKKRCSRLLTRIARSDAEEPCVRRHCEDSM